MNRTQLHNPNTVGQKTIERAVYHLIDSGSQPTDPAKALLSVVIRACDNDRNAKRDIPAILRDLSTKLSSLMDEADRVGHAYQESLFDLKDNPEILSHLRGEGAGHSEVPASLAALPPACVAHVLKRHERSKWMGKLNSPEVIERTEMEHIAREMVDEALPLAVLGQGEYRREIGGE